MEKWNLSTVPKFNINTNTIICFDIEVSTAFISCDDIIPWTGQSDEWCLEHQRVALPYIWMLSIGQYCYYGRDFKQFKEALDWLDSYDVDLIIWVHNLGYEMEFIINLIQYDKVFARTPHHPIYVQWHKLQFRCSYMLTRLSLEDWGKMNNAKIIKKTADGFLFDYQKIRTPLTLLTAAEMDYCERDVMTMFECLKIERTKYGTLSNIPLTQTGIPRRVLKNAQKSNMPLKYKLTSLLPPNAGIYMLLKQAFWGGLTKANYLYANRVLSEPIVALDIASSYPWQMVSKRYPMTPFKPCLDILPYLNERYCLLIDVTINNIDSKTALTYIPYSKCYAKRSCILDNGKIMSAASISLVVTNVDYDIINKYYDYDDVIINQAYYSIAYYLPPVFVDFLLENYGDKTKLKGIDDMLAIYNFAKQCTNSAYGMMVTSLVHPDTTYINGDWPPPQKITPQMIDAKLEELRNKPYKQINAYQWGVWITAYARKQLTDLQWDLRDYWIYSDTDSNKVIDNDYVRDVLCRHNKAIDAERHALADYLSIDYERLAPLDSKGVAHPLGAWEIEDIYSQFITLGAKRYAYRSTKDDKLHVTISGINPEFAAADLDGDISNFKFGRKFKADPTRRGSKLMVDYVHDMPTVTWQRGQYDEWTSDLQHGVAMWPHDYTIKEDGDYQDFLQNLQDFTHIADLPDDAVVLHKLYKQYLKGELL